MKNKDKKRNRIFGVTIILMTIYLGWRVLFTLPIGEGFLNMVFGILLIVAEMVTIFTTFELFYQKIKMDKFHLECPDIPESHYPHVDVFIATHNEPIDILYKTVNGCTFMDYPDKDKVHIYICDDGNRPEVANLAKEFGVGYFGLANNKEAKSGNLNNALKQTTSPLIATFDADMIPQHTFLMKTVPYFFLPQFIKEDKNWRLRKEDELLKDFKMGLIQTQQSFYNPDLFQFNLFAEGSIPNEQDFFSKEINTMRNASNSIAYTGSNTVIARKAMEDIGGFPLKTITEDFETSIRIQKAGYITYATDEIQASGLTTTTIKSMLKQRVRWARGIIQSLQNTNAIFTRKLPLVSRITYLSSFLYWWSFFNRLIFILSPILFALFDFKIVNNNFKHMLIFWLPAYFFYSTSMRYLSSNIRNQRWSQVVDTIFMPYLIIPVFLETIHIRDNKFKVTNKKKESHSNPLKSIIYAIPHILLIIMSIAALFRYVKGKYGWSLFYSNIIIFWISSNLVALFYAIFFMLGRRTHRSSERIAAEENLSIQYMNITYEAKTKDVSENGLSFWSKKPIYLPEDDMIEFVITTPRYKSKLEGKIVYVKQLEEGWRYAASIQPIDDENKRQYMQIIYDRIHSLPKKMNLWITAYDDMLRNVEKRVEPQFSDKRRTPRIPLDKKIVFTNGASCRLINFNYGYFLVSDFITNGRFDEEFTFETESGILLVLKRKKNQQTKSTKELLEVANIKSLVEHHQLEQVLEDLTNENLTEAI